MRTLTHRVEGEQVTIKVAESGDDEREYIEFVQRNKAFLSFDTEGTGLNVFHRDYSLRLAQFGDREGREAWVLPVERGPRWAWLAKTTLEHVDHLTAHNLNYDAMVADQHLGVPLEKLLPKGSDTGILSRLADSRAFHEGGHGHGLEEITKAFIDAEVAAAVKGSINDQVKDLKSADKGLPRAEKQWVGLKKDTYWRMVPLDYEPYLRYAGMDPILTSRARSKLVPKVPSESYHLVPYEHELALVCALLMRRGILVDLEYALAESEKLSEEEARWKTRAERLGLENVNSPVQVVEALRGYGWEPVPGEVTDGGQPAVRKQQLGRLMKGGGTLGKLAESIYNAKRAGKWNKAYFRRILEEADPQGRIHPNINPMQARTARMSITKPAVQTLPSGLRYVRNAFLAEPGELYWSADYLSQELRVMAAFSNDRVMRDAFEQGKDLHALTAMAAFGSAYDEDKHRKLGKVTNFGSAYGVGVNGLVDQTGVSPEVAKQLLAAFWGTYRGADAYRKELKQFARKHGYIVTKAGRRLFVDKARDYSSLNYDIQSFSRDVTAQGMIRTHRGGLLDYVRLPVHDELNGSVPAKQAREIVYEISQLMRTTLRGVDIATDMEIGGDSWGTLMKDKDNVFLEEDDDEAED